MENKKKLSVKEMIESVVPQTGEWSLCGSKDKTLQKNLASKTFVRNWVRTKVLESYTGVNEKELDEYLQSKHFLHIIQKYQNKIIDLQIENSFKGDSGLIIGCIVRNNPEKAVNELMRNVSYLLTVYLGMKESVVENRLKEKRAELLEKFSNPKPFSKVGYNPFDD